MSLLQIQPDVKDDMVECCLHTPVFGKAFFAEHLWREFNSIHDELFKLLDNVKLPRIAIAAPRGLGKSTLTILYAIKAAVFQEARYICIVSQTASLAAQLVRTIGNFLTSSEKLVKAFGDLKGPVWSLGEGNLKLTNGVTIRAKGSGQQVRGQQDEFARPDLVICDDLEDSEPFRLGDASEYLRKLKQWFRADLSGSLDLRGARMIVVGTILGQDALLQNLLDRPSWESIRIELCDDNYRSNFPDFMSDAEVLRLKEEHEAEGQLDLFYQEYRNISIATETAIFKSKYFKYYKDDYDPIRDYRVDKIVIIDPAKTTNTKSAYSAVICIGFNALKNHIYFMDCVNDRMHPDEIIECAVSMAIRNRTRNIAVEVTSLENFITYPFNSYLSKKGFPSIIELKARGKKVERIRNLSPFYRRGEVYHNPDKNISGPLEAQLITFDRSKYFDIMDAFAYSIELFAIGDRYFAATDDADDNLDSFNKEIAAMDKEDGPYPDSELANIHWAP